MIGLRLAVLVLSYARPDRLQVRAVVSLLRGAMSYLEAAVFWDGDFRAGDEWFEQMKRHIDDSPKLFVWWCNHSAASPTVRREFLYTFEHGKKVIPVLIDETPLSDELSPIHGIDLRGAIVHPTPLIASDIFEEPEPVRPDDEARVISGFATHLDPTRSFD